jgi:DNA-binding PadR family transcriptional regulator
MTPPADPLTPHRFHILAALADRDLHGSGIVRDVLAQTDDGLRLWPVTLYKHLDEMASEGWIRELTGEERPEGVSERSRYYRITATGRRILEAEAERLTSIASQARRRLGRA